MTEPTYPTLTDVSLRARQLDDSMDLFTKTKIEFYENLTLAYKRAKMGKNLIIVTPPRVSTFDEIGKWYTNELKNYNIKLIHCTSNPKEGVLCAGAGCCANDAGWGEGLKMHLKNHIFEDGYGNSGKFAWQW